MRLPSQVTTDRAGLDLLLHEVGVRPEVLAEGGDLTLLRPRATEVGTVSLGPPLIVELELA